eukprot:scaffold75320_cov61-Phaeocystis_antarctica.AAC.2
MASSTETAPRCTVCAVHGGGGGEGERLFARAEGGSILVGEAEAEVEGEAAYLAAGEAVREVAGEVTGEATGEVAAGGAVTAGGNCTASWQRAASSSTSDQRSCGGTPPVVYGMAPPLRSRRGGGTAHHGRGGSGFHGWRRACHGRSQYGRAQAARPPTTTTDGRSGRSTGRGAPVEEHRSRTVVWRCTTASLSPCAHSLWAQSSSLLLTLFILAPSSLTTVLRKSSPLCPLLPSPPAPRPPPLAMAAEWAQAQCQTCGSIW